jgi:outer membrane protein insertion porin family
VNTRAVLSVFVASCLAFAAGAAAQPAADDATASATDGTPAQLEAIEFIDRVYFREQTLKGFMAHPDPPSPLDEPMLERDRAIMEARYKDRGYLRARVELEVKPGVTPNAFRAIYRIKAGPRAELRQVDIVGNVDVDDATLKAGLFSRPPEPFGALTRAGLFHKPFLDQDGQRVVANYYRLGYLEARVLETRVHATSDLDALSIVMRVHEGRVYELASVAFTGDLPEGETSESLREKLSLKDGDVADLVTVQQESDKLLDPLRDLGHAFARLEQAIAVAPPPSGDPERRAIALTLNVVKGPEVTVRKVRIVGNEKTMDHVVLRDVEIEEGVRYDHSLLSKAERRLMGLGFFQQVTVKPVRIPGEDEVVDVEVTVKEVPTWLFSIAPSFNGAEGLIGIGLLADRNLFGTGLFGSFQGVVSGLRQTFDVRLTEPRVLGSRVSASVELHRRESSYFSSQARHRADAFYRWRSELGAGANVSVPIAWGLWVTGGALVEYGGAIPGAGADPAVSELFPGRACAPTTEPPPPDAAFDRQAGAFFESIGTTQCEGVFKNRVSLGASWDRRDSVLSPRNGVYAQASAAYTGPWTLAGVSALTTTGSLRLYWSPLWEITFKTNSEVGVVVNPHGGRVPVTERFFVGGGIGSVRGFFPSSIGPERVVPTQTGGRARVNIGGVLNVLQNTELEFPLWPGTPFRGFLFFDAGNAFGEDEVPFSSSPSELGRGSVSLPYGVGRAFLPLGLYLSTGLGVVIETPALPLRLQLSLPLTRREIDPEPDFLFWVGSAF